MRLVSYTDTLGTTGGIVRGGSVFTLSSALASIGMHDVPDRVSVRELLEQHGSQLPQVAASVGSLTDADALELVAPLAELILAPPVSDPAKVVCVGLNYTEHVLETGRALPEHPDLFPKFTSTLIGATQQIGGSSVSTQLDFEGELAIVIGQHCSNVAENDALDVIAGVSILNDVSARDLQYRGTQWLAGKAVDGSTPIGPELVTLDEVGDLQTLDISTRVNGQTMQSSNTRHMIFSVAKIVEYITSFMSLAPGDVIATGTPEGIGAKRNPPVWLRPGDVVEIEIERVGVLSSVVAAPESTAFGSEVKSVEEPREVEALIVGAGMGGLLSLRKLTKRGIDALVIDKAAGVGGTWFHNRYPGAMSDSEAPFYQLPGEPELYQQTPWRGRYAMAPEIRAYLENAVDFWDLRDRIQLDTTLISAVFDEAAGRWDVQTDGGSFRARFLVTALGLLSRINMPSFPGVEKFEGQIVHTAAWPDDLDLRGKRVGVIGNGSTGVQLMTEISRSVGHLTSFQRTAQYSVPARNRQYTESELRDFRDRCTEMWAEVRKSKVGFGLDEVERTAFSVSAAEREEIFEKAWENGNNMAFLIETFSDLGDNRAANDEAADFIRRKIAETVRDPETARKLTPTEPFARRPICDSGYYEMFNLPHVALVNIRETPIREFTEAGIVTEDGKLHELDVLIMATGFDAVDGSYRTLDIRGRGGVSLAEHWADGPRSRFGISVAGFPNMFMVLGPAGPFVNLPIAIGEQTEWISDAIASLHIDEGVWMDLSEGGEQAWIDDCWEAIKGSLSLETGSWTVSANIPGKRRPSTVNFYTAGLKAFAAKADAETASGYANYTIHVPSGQVATPV